MKCLLHIIYRCSEIERICGEGGWHNLAMTEKFAGSLKRSRQLTNIKKAVFLLKLYDVRGFVEGIIAAKDISRSKVLVVANISHCLHYLRFANAVVIEFEALKVTEFNRNEQGDIALLESLWENLKPGDRRRPLTSPNSTDLDDIRSSDWSEIGFQGVDPSTDFRGMGKLGLQQLVHFSTVRNQSARAILLESNHPRRFFPFSATGINFTLFVIEMLRETRLHGVLLRSLEREAVGQSFASGDGPSASRELLQMGCTVVHDMYCDVFEDFNRLWVSRDPPNVMAFHSLFTELKASYRARYPPFAGP